MKGKIIALVLLLSMIITYTSGCKNKKSYDEISISKIDTSKLDNYSITELVDLLSDQHELDEIFDTLNYIEKDGTKKSLKELEEEYIVAYKDNNITEMNKAVYKISRLIICAKINELNIARVNNTGLDVSTYVTEGTSSSPKIEANGIVIHLNSADDDEINKLAINSENAMSLVNGCRRPTTSSEIYHALKRSILVSSDVKECTFSEGYKITGGIDENKYKKLTK